MLRMMAIVCCGQAVLTTQGTPVTTHQTTALGMFARGMRGMCSSSPWERTSAWAPGAGTHYACQKRIFIVKKIIAVTVMIFAKAVFTEVGTPQQTDVTAALVRTAPLRNRFTE
jgi:hypothetical protein